MKKTIPALCGLFAALTLTLTGTSEVVAYPEKPVVIVVPYKAGGNSDRHTRLLQPALQDALGADIVVKNVAGAAGTVGAAQVAQAKPDGHMLAMMPIAPPTMQPHLRDLPYGIDSFEPVCMVDNNPVVLMVNKTSPYKSVQDLVSAAKANPGSLTYGTTGGGTVPHLAAIGFLEGADVSMKHVPFSNAADVMKAILGEVVTMFIGPASLVERFDVRPLAIFASEAVPMFADVPTAKSEGLDLVFSIWGGLFAPAGIPEETYQTLTAACAKAVADPRTTEAMAKIKSNADPRIGEDFKSFVLSQYELNGRLLGKADLQK